MMNMNTNNMGKKVWREMANKPGAAECYQKRNRDWEKNIYIYRLFFSQSLV